MQTKSLLRLLAFFALMVFAAGFGSGLAKDGTQAEPSTEKILSEVRQHFTFHGKLIPPEMFRVFDDDKPADLKGIGVTVDLDAAMDDDSSWTDFRIPKMNKDWVTQVCPPNYTCGNDKRKNAYKFVGTTDNKLLVVVTSHHSGGADVLFTLHILDGAAARAFDEQGQPYQHINLTLLRSVFLYGYYPKDGKVSISHNLINIVTKSHDPDHGDTSTTKTIEAERP